MGLSNSTILILDDEENVRELFKINLEKLGCKTITVNNSDEAIRCYQQSLTSTHSIDAIIMDLTLPGDISGKEIAGIILNLDPQAKIIISSGHSDSPEMTHFQEYGFNAALEKNFNRNKLKQVLEQVLEFA